MRSMFLPPVGYGPGSQPEAEEGPELAYLPMPSGMQTFQMHIPYEADSEALKEVLPVLAQLADMADGWKAGAVLNLPIDHLSPRARKLMDETLGEGEVSIIIEDDPRIEIQESVFAGIWRLRRRDAQGQVLADRIEVADIPAVVRARSFIAPLPRKVEGEAIARRGVVNAPAILTEVAEKSVHYVPGQPQHVVNLTLLPHTPEDLDCFEEVMGKGRTVILSRGYGNCRIDATRWAHVWRVRFYNSMDVQIADTIEVVDVPEVAMAAPEDIRDSAFRMREVMEAMQ